MIVRYSQIIGAAVIELKEQQNLGKISEIVLNKNDLTIRGFLVDLPKIFSSKKILSFNEVVEINPKAVIVNNDSALADFSESVRIKKAIDEGFLGVGHKVSTKSNKSLGRLYDYIILSQSGKILKLYVKSLFSDRIIPTSSVIDVKRRKIIIDDDFELIKTKKNQMEIQPVK